MSTPFYRATAADAFGLKRRRRFMMTGRHVEAGFGDKVAYHWVGDGERETREITYADLQAMVCRAANALTEMIHSTPSDFNA